LIQMGCCHVLYSEEKKWSFAGLMY